MKGTASGLHCDGFHAPLIRFRGPVHHGRRTGGSQAQEVTVSSDGQRICTADLPKQSPGPTSARISGTLRRSKAPHAKRGRLLYVEARGFPGSRAAIYVGDVSETHLLQEVGAECSLAACATSHEDRAVAIGQAGLPQVLR